MGFQSPGLNLDVSCPKNVLTLVEVQIQSLSNENNEQGKYFPYHEEGYERK